MAVRVLSLSTTVRLEAASLNGAPLPHPRNTNPTPRLSFTKPSWVVRTESNVHKEEKIKPDPPCVVCLGSGRTACHICHGKDIQVQKSMHGTFPSILFVSQPYCCMAGRTNCTHLEMLPKGEWPKWCKTCGGSGLSCCPRCLGTGEYRYIMGFHFMKRDANHTPDHKNEFQSNQKRGSVADFYEQESIN